MNFLKKNCSNMSELEINIRWIASIVFAILACVTPYWYLFFATALLMYQNLIKNCFLYSALGLRSELKKRNEYLQALPNKNPEPIMVINHDAQIEYRNQPAKDIFSNNNTFEFLNNKEFLNQVILNEDTKQIEHKFSEDKIYTFVLKGVRKLNAIMVYGTDITNIIKAEQEIINTQKDIVYTMGAIGESRSNETGNHVKRVAIYSEILALRYGLSKEEASLLKLASPMHDIGKVGIKDKILNKPGKLTDDEFKIMKTHSTLGYNMLKNSDKEILKAAAIVAHQHHEKWDGSGYPKKLKGEDIHIFGRITAIADVFDALGSQRVYKEAWPLEDIFELFKKEKGKHFDPKLVDLFFENFDEINEVRLKYVDNVKKKSN
ncbi:MAG: HD domain-containing phosphohydrolase [Poseidonibacter sp.]|uniref:HD domain-containing phosphohydrolase n=1 Tax=Poseidonibacter sp. TaxID=2321188 RepID=UPI00359F019A